MVLNLTETFPLRPTETSTRANVAGDELKSHTFDDISREQVRGQVWGFWGKVPFYGGKIFVFIVCGTLKGPSSFYIQKSLRGLFTHFDVCIELQNNISLLPLQEALHVCQADESLN